MGVAKSRRASFPSIARHGERADASARDAPPCAASNENVPRALPAASHEFTGTNSRTSTAASTTAANTFTAANVPNDTRSPCVMPAAAHAAGG